MNTKIIAILMASIVAMAMIAPMAMGGDESQTAESSASVGNVDPAVTNALVAPDPVAMKPCQDGTTPITVTATVSDANGAGDIDTVKVNIPDITAVPVDMNCVPGDPVETTLSCSVVIDLDCCTEAKDYTATVTAKDNSAATGDDDYIFTVDPTNALSLNFDKVAFSGAAGTDNNPGDASLLGVPEANPEVKSEGNAEIDIGVLASNLLNATIPATIGGDNMNATIGGIGPEKVKPEHRFDTNTTCEGVESAAFTLNIPAGTSKGTYDGDITVTAKV